MDCIVNGERALGPVTLFTLDGLCLGDRRQGRLVLSGRRGGVARRGRGLVANDHGGDRRARGARAGEDRPWQRRGGHPTRRHHRGHVRDRVDAGHAGALPRRDRPAPEDALPTSFSSTADHVRAAVGPFRRIRSLCSACSGAPTPSSSCERHSGRPAPPPRSRAAPMASAASPSPASARSPRSRPSCAGPSHCRRSSAPPSPEGAGFLLLEREAPPAPAARARSPSCAAGGGRRGAPHHQPRGRGRHRGAGGCAAPSIARSLARRTSTT